MTARRSRFDLADAAMLGVVLIWAENNVLVKTALSELDPLAYVVGRLAIVSLLLFAWLAARRRFEPPRRADLLRFLVVGLVGYAAYNVLFTIGLERTSVFSVALLVSLGPIFTLLFAAAIGLERVRPGQWLGVALATAGVAVFVGEKLWGAAPYQPLGELLSLIAAALFAGYSLATRPLVARYGAPAATGWSACGGLLLILPIAGRATVEQEWSRLSLGAWGSLFYASAISMLGGYTLWTWAIERRGVGRTAPYLFLVPVVTGVLSALFFGERFGPTKLAGAALVLLGTSLVRFVGGAARIARSGGEAAAGRSES